MVTYKYTAMSTDGAKINGVIDAVDEYSAVARIKSQYPIVIKIEPVVKNEKLAFLSRDISKKVDLKALSVMCSQFSIMLESGMNIAVCMRMIANQTEDKKLRQMLLSSSQDVAQGAPVAASFEKNCEGLPITFIETVRAGELSGTLEHSFRTLEQYYSKSYQLSQKIRSAMSYPLFVLFIAIVVLFVIMLKVVPTLTSVFGELGGELPAVTQFLINTSEFFASWWWLMVGLILIAIIAGVLYARKMFFGKLMLKMPVLGKINTLNGAAQFANTMSALLEAGLPVGNALGVTAKVMDNYVLSEELRQIVDKVEAGYRLGDCMRQSKYFPQILQEMTSIGEDTGELEKTLQVIGTYYTNESDHAVQAAISKLEPTIMIFLALFAGFIVIAIYLPMFTMYDLM
ncbi:MAG: type II secretion system F family protein [Lachnospiraceae bacterium]|nr:type II secretion system F family protein [Lachnospiraceae bacterium]